MPPKRQRKKKQVPQVSVERKAPLVGSYHETATTVPRVSFDPLQSLRALKQGKSSRKTVAALGLTDFEFVPGSKETKDDEQESVDFKAEAALLKNVVKMLFKADKPYRCRLGYFNNVATSAAGVLNFSINVNSIGSVAEWSSIDALFDECFVHSMTWRYQPYNRHGSAGTNTAGGPAIPQVATASAGLVNTCGVVLVSLFHGAPNYATANAMLDNATMKLALSDEPWSYAWRNNERFDPRGPGMSDGTGLSWQGWMNVTNVARLAGNIQMRTAVDQALGDLTHALDLGSIAVLFDVSFRARS